MERFRQGRKAGVFPLLVRAAFFLTIFAGVVGVVLPSVDFFPAAGKTGMGLGPWISMLSAPGLARSIGVTVFSGAAATAVSVGLTGLFTALLYRTRVWNRLEKTLSPMLAVPHAAVAVGLAFLVAPSGWIIRVVSPGLTGFEFPPDWMLVNDRYGLCLTLALVMKEFPFLVMVTLSAVGRIEVNEILRVGQSLGYEKTQIWLKVLIPRLYPHLRLSVYAIFAYSLSVVDMALILGPSSPPTFAVTILKWFNDPDISHKVQAAAGSLVLFAMVAAGIGVIRGCEKTAAAISNRWMVNGTRRSMFTCLKQPLALGIYMLISLYLFCFLVLICWSFSLVWRFPAALPSEWTLTFWTRGLSSSAGPVLTTLITGGAAVLVSMVLAVGCLENDARRNNGPAGFSSTDAIFYLPLLLPQISFMAGVQLLLVMCRLDGMWGPLVWSHSLFVLPYVFITLKATWMDFDHRITDQAVLLGKSYTTAFFRVKLPMLIRPVLFSGAIGFSVSVAQYIPTILVGSGRFSTITTEVVTLSSGSDRRVVAVYSLIQLFWPMVVYGLAILLPKTLYYKKKGMQ